MRFPDDGEDLFAWFLGTLVCVAAASLLALGIRAAIADHRPDYCYVINNYGRHIVLRAHCPWASDDNIGEFNTVEEAATAAKAINCPIGKP